MTNLVDKLCQALPLRDGMRAEAAELIRETLEAVRLDTARQETEACARLCDDYYKRAGFRESMAQEAAMAAHCLAKDIRGRLPDEERRGYLGPGMKEPIWAGSQEELLAKVTGTPERPGNVVRKLLKEALGELSSIAAEPSPHETPESLVTAYRFLANRTAQDIRDQLRAEAIRL